MNQAKPASSMHDWVSFTTICMLPTQSRGWCKILAIDDYTIDESVHADAFICIVNSVIIFIIIRIYFYIIKCCVAVLHCLLLLWMSFSLIKVKGQKKNKGVPNIFLFQAN